MWLAKSDHRVLGKKLSRRETIRQRRKEPKGQTSTHLTSGKTPHPIIQLREKAHTHGVKNKGNNLNKEELFLDRIPKVCSDYTVGPLCTVHKAHIGYMPIGGNSNDWKRLSNLFNQAFPLNLAIHFTISV